MHEAGSSQGFEIPHYKHKENLKLIPNTKHSIFGALCIVYITIKLSSINPYLLNKLQQFIDTLIK